MNTKNYDINVFWDAPIIIDLGSLQTRVGFASDTTPRSIIPSVVGYEQFRTMADMCLGPRNAVGREALMKQSMLHLLYPLESGTISNNHPHDSNDDNTDWDDLQALWRYIFSDVLSVSSEQYPVLLTESILLPSHDREKMAEIMFEEFATPALYMANQADLSLNVDRRRKNALVIDMGYTKTEIVPVVNGQTQYHATSSIPIGGRDLTQYLMQLTEHHQEIISPSKREFDIQNQNKERFGYVALDPSKERSSIAKHPDTYERSAPRFCDDNIILREERFQCTEPLFQPNLCRKNAPGIPIAATRCINQCHPDVHRELYRNIILIGGSSKFEGMKERIIRELQLLSPEKDVQINVTTLSDNAQIVAWKGGALFASDVSFPQKTVSLKEYQENGSSIIHQQKK
eukprot:gb/GECH01013689.1/.p1 GENE.gb/GECH01013689.1/~~gb/GECH01013689.1/.p1  ORF type:complete len:401 (+),score=92.37 gb/GECH01013689.1/:1-1203(+)